jgi:hypothetical protein
MNYRLSLLRPIPATLTRLPPGCVTPKFTGYGPRPGGKMPPYPPEAHQEAMICLRIAEGYAELAGVLRG